MRLIAPLLDACAKHSGVGSALDLRRRFGIVVAVHALYDLAVSVFLLPQSG